MNCCKRAVFTHGYITASSRADCCFEWMNCKILSIYVNRQIINGFHCHYYTNYFLAGGLDTKKNRGKINLYKLISEDENNLKGIEFTQEIILIIEISILTNSTI